jgi:hypothetical protein
MTTTTLLLFCGLLPRFLTFTPFMCVPWASCLAADLHNSPTATRLHCLPARLDVHTVKTRLSSDAMSECLECVRKIRLMQQGFVRTIHINSPLLSSATIYHLQGCCQVCCNAWCCLPPCEYYALVTIAVNVWSHSSSTLHLNILFVTQREHNT